MSASSIRGFQLLELAIVLAALGVITLMASFAFSGVDQKNTRAQSAAEAENAREAIRAFLLANKRLPCPDTNADSHEDCGGTAESGHLPYASLGLTENTHNRMRYSVYRAAAPNDVTQLAERTDDAEGDPDYRGYGDTLAALAQIPAMPLDEAHIHITGLAADGASDCAAAAHPAFALIVPNRDADGDSNVLDGANAAGLCLASPRQPAAWNYDDFVLAESAAALAGWLARHIN
ncbi:MAG: hypothetical protein LBO00_00580 [Zoogloeaceae bacterium]|jgi:type II secretory pathway pseudopilin PulG|nr:hypothetical protein [Zoogloeaceae bacterium]